MILLTFLAPISQNGQTHSNNLPAICQWIIECVWPFCGIGAYRVNIILFHMIYKLYFMSQYPTLAWSWKWR